MDCTIHIPKKNEHYTIYADGKLTNLISTDNGVFVTLDDSFVFCLYYTVGKFRRLYVCTRFEFFSGEIFSPIEVTSLSKLAVIDVLEGRAFDRFKRSMAYLVRATFSHVREYPPLFYAQLALMCHLNHADRMNLRLLVKKFDPSLKLEDIKWT